MALCQDKQKIVHEIENENKLVLISCMYSIAAAVATP